MAYVIGSKKGQDIAKNMTVGSTYKASDGSTWTKNKDGSVSVTHNGQTTSNAYKPTSNSTGGGGGGGSSNKTYSQYAGVDLGTLGQEYMNSGADWRTVKDVYDQRYNKAMGTPELNQYANDSIQDAMLDYILKAQEAENRAPEKESKADYEDVVQNRPGEYNAKYDPQIEALLNEILNRADFSYDANSDPLYQQYADMYQREGDRAMKETMAEAAASAGGMNTYAITAAQQAANNYAAQLNDIIPELYQLSYQMYLGDKESKVQDLGLLQSMDATQYNRYRDTMADWKDDRNFAFDVYQSDVNQGNWQTNFDYNAIINDRNFNSNEAWRNKEFNYNDFWRNKEWDYNDEWKNKEWDHDIGREQIDDSRYDQNISREDRELAKEEVWKYISLGIAPSADLLAKAGMSQTDVDLAVAAKKAEQSKTNTSTGGTGKGKGNGGTETKQTGGGGDPEEEGTVDSGYDNGGLSTDKIKKLQKTLGVTPDGFWGSESQKAAAEWWGSKYSSAEAAWEKLGDGDSGDMSDYTVSNQHADAWVNIPGWGRYSWQEIAIMVENGEVIETVDNKNKTITYKKA